MNMFYNVIAVKCGEPEKAGNVIKMGSGHEFKDIVNYTCDVGFEMAEYIKSEWTSIRCGADGNWT